MNQKYFTVYRFCEVTIFKGVVLKKWRKESRLAYPDFLQVKQVIHKDLDCYFALFFGPASYTAAGFSHLLGYVKSNNFYV